jgi:hypothetical protein
MVYPVEARRKEPLMRTTIISVLAILLVVAGCSSSDPTASDEYLALEQELTVAEQQLAETEQELVQAEAQVVAVTAEQDTAAEAAASGDRYAAAARVQEEIMALLDDPGAFGSGAEVADLLATHATSDALMDDDVFGSVNYRNGFYNTLFVMADAEIDIYDSWL